MAGLPRSASFVPARRSDSGASRPRPRLVRIGPTTWVEADWCKGLCVTCEEPLAKGSVIACVEHRRQIDALLMPWESKP